MTEKPLNSYYSHADRERLIADTTRFKPYRMKLASEARAVLNEIGLTWYLEGGTLLGAYRDGRIIAHDDDFDIAAYVPQVDDVTALLDGWKRQVDPLLPAAYACRVVTSYATKLELFEPAHGHYPLRDTNFHNVTCDITLHTEHPDEPGRLLIHHIDCRDHRVLVKRLQPLGVIEIEGQSFNAPHDTQGYLEDQYGYIGADCQYDPVTKKYEKRT